MKSPYGTIVFISEGTNTNHMAVKYASVKIPRGLVDNIVAEAIQKLCTYRTVSEFVIESARRQLENLRPADQHTLS